MFFNLYLTEQSVINGQILVQLDQNENLGDES